MFWTVYGRNGRIYKSTMSGDNRILIMEDDQKPSGDYDRPIPYTCTSQNQKFLGEVIFLNHGNSIFGIATTSSLHQYTYMPT